MPIPRAERELKRMMVKLRALPQADFDAVLASLTEDQRKRILALLKDLEGKAGRAAAASTLDSSTSHAGLALDPALSPWLVARIERSPTESETGSGPGITMHAWQALRMCAVATAPQPQNVASPRKSLVGHLLGLAL